MDWSLPSIRSRGARPRKSSMAIIHCRVLLLETVFSRSENSISIRPWLPSWPRKCLRISALKLVCSTVFGGSISFKRLRRVSPAFSLPWIVSAPRVLTACSLLVPLVDVQVLEIPFNRQILKVYILDIKLNLFFLNGLIFKNQRIKFIHRVIKFYHLN